MRWQYCAQPPDRNLLFGFGPAQEIKRRLLTLWNSAKFLGDYGAIESFQPVYADLEPRRARTADLQPLDRWLVERTAQLVAEAEAGYERWLTVDVTRAFEAYVDDLSNWYIRRSRRRFWDGDEAALRTLWFGLVQGAARDRAGDAVPRRASLAGARHATSSRARRTRSSSPAGPRRATPDVGAARRGRGAAERRRARPPGAVGVGPEAAPAAAADRRRGRPARRRPRRRDRRGAPREGGRVRPRRRRAAGEAAPAGARAEAREGARRRPRRSAGGRRSRSSSGGRFRVAGPRARRRRRCSSSGRARTAGRSPADAGVTVAIDTAVDDELALEGRVYELIHRVNSMRKDAGLELTDRIAPDDPGRRRRAARACRLDRPRDARAVRRRRCGGRAAIESA